MKNTPLIPFEVSEALIQAGQRLKQARLARGDTLMLAGERVGVHAQTVSRAEAGDPAVSAGVLFALLACYGMSERLFALSEPDETTERLAIRQLPKRGKRQPR